MHAVVFGAARVSLVHHGMTNSDGGVGLQVRSVVRALRAVPGDTVRALRGRPTSPDTYLVVRRMNVRTGGRFGAGLASVIRHLPGVADVVDTATRTRLLGIWADEVTTLDTHGVCRVPDAFTPGELADLVEFATNGPATVQRRSR